MGVTNPPVFVLGNQSNKAATNLPSTWPLGGWYYDIYGQSSYPNNYGTLLNFTSTHTNAVTQIYHTWDNQGGAGGTTALWARSNRDTNNQFGAFQPLFLGAQGSSENMIQTGSFTAANQSYTGNTYYYHSVSFYQEFKSNPIIMCQYSATIFYTAYLNYAVEDKTTAGFRLYWAYGTTTTRAPAFDWIAIGEG
jgi:YHS domain-containing protein